MPATQAMVRAQTVNVTSSHDDQDQPGEVAVTERFDWRAFLLRAVLLAPVAVLAGMYGASRWLSPACGPRRPRI